MSFRTMRAGDNTMRFEFATAARILFGPGTLREVAPAAAGLGQRVLVVTGRTVRASQTVIRPS